MELTYSWQAIGESIQQPELIQSGLSGFLSKSINRVFFRDINGDGLEDLVIPRAGSLSLYIASDRRDFKVP